MSPSRAMRLAKKPCAMDSSVPTSLKSWAQASSVMGCSYGRGWVFCHSSMLGRVAPSVPTRKRDTEISFLAVASSVTASRSSSMPESEPMNSSMSHMPVCSRDAVTSGASPTPSPSGFGGRFGRVGLSSPPLSSDLPMSLLPIVFVWPSSQTLLRS